MPGVQRHHPAAAVETDLRRPIARSCRACRRRSADRRLLGRGGLRHRRAGSAGRSGGAAVVLGALSPRTRNAQVDMYQAGDVDYIVATDAIGMGLNLDVDHIAFAADKQVRRLAPPPPQPRRSSARSLAAPAATYATARSAPPAAASPFDNDLVELLENHRFRAGRPCCNGATATLDFEFARIARRRRSTLLPGEPGLTRRTARGQDQMVLDIATRDPEVRKVATQPWRHRCACGTAARFRTTASCRRRRMPISSCRYTGSSCAPDTSPTTGSPATSTRSIGSTARSIRSPPRIAQVRTWTFIANRPDWLRDPEHWQGVARRVEDTLSDAPCIERLAQRFVDRRTSVLMPPVTRECDVWKPKSPTSGDVMVEGQHVGQLNGFPVHARTRRRRARRRVGAERRRARRRSPPRSRGGARDPRPARRSTRPSCSPTTG